MHTCWELRILGQKPVFLLFFDKNIMFSGCKGYAEIFFLSFKVEYKLFIFILDNTNVQLLSILWFW